MKKIKIITAIIVVVLIIFDLMVCPLGVKKVNAEVFDNYEYENISGSSVKITKYIGDESVLAIPDKIDGKTVDEIGNWAFCDCKNLRKVNIPDSITNIGEYTFCRCTNLEEIRLSNEIDQIGSQVFWGCESLQEISIPNKVKRIGGRAFQGCLSLSTINIPSNVSEIGESAFYYCEGLREINILGEIINIEEKTFCDCSNLNKITMPKGIMYIGKAAFLRCTSLREVYIPDTVVSLGLSVFSGCTSLKKVNIPQSVNSIEAYAFSDCKELEEIDIPSGVTNIEGTFSGCTSLNKISIPSSITDIDRWTFRDCNNLKDIYFAGTRAQWDEITITTNGNEVLSNVTIHFSDDSTLNDSEGFKYEILNDGTIEITECTSSNEVITIPEQIDGKTVTGIHSSTFINNWDWKEIIIPASITTIGDNNFECCTKLETIRVVDENANYKSVDGVLFSKDQTILIKYPQGKDGVYNIPSGTERIEQDAFSDSFDLTSVIIPKSVTTIGYGAFSFCLKLAEINIPSSVTSIDGSAFIGCDSLTNLEIPSSMKSISYCCFDNCKNLTTVTIPKSITFIANAAFYKCDNLKDIYYDGILEQWGKITIGTGGIGGIDSSINTNVPLVNAVIHFSDGTTLNGPKEEFSYKELGDGTVEITKYNGSDSIVMIPEQLDQKKVVRIGSAAFYQNTEVTEVSIPDGVTKISQSAFHGCKNMTKISIPDSVTEMELHIFNGCENLTAVNLPDSLTSIGSYTFMDCKALKEIHIPESVNEICKDTFHGCSSLQDVYYSGTKRQWEKIEIDTIGNDELLSAKIHCKEEPPEGNNEEIILPITVDAKQELERLKSGDPFSLEPDFKHYLSMEQIDVLESYLYTWLAEVNYTHQYSGTDGVRECIRKKSGIDPQGDFVSGKERAVTHIVAETKYGSRTFEVTLELGAPDSSGNLYPSYGAMHYEVLEKGNLPSDLPVSGQIGRNTYADLGTFAEGVKKTSEDSLHHTYQWQSLDDEMTAGVLVDKTVTEIIGNKNGSFSQATFTIYVKPLLTYSKKITIACPVDVFVYSMDGSKAGSIVNSQPYEENQNVRLDVNGDTKTVYLTGNDYYLNLRGTDTGTMKYEVEEIANEEVRRNVQFLELQLKKDMQYEGYVFRPLNIDRDLYALRAVDGGSKEVIYADTDSYQSTFKRVQQMSLSQQNSSLNEKSTVQLNASLLPSDASNPNLNWTTDNESVVSVDSNGLVTAVGAGRATVTVSTKDGSFLKQYCMFDVADKNSNSGDESNHQPGGDSSGSGSEHVPGNSGSGGSGGNSGSGGSGSAGGLSGNFGQPAQKPEQPVVVKMHYVIQFDTNGGTNLSRRTMTLLEGDSPGIMPKVQRKDYLFSGWYTQKEGGKQVAGDQPLEEAATLYARWIRASAPPKTASIKLVSKKKGQVQVSFQKVTGAAGYQAEYATSKNFASATTKSIGANAKTKTLTGLKDGKKYYVRVRAYVLDSMGNKIYGAYSTVESIRMQA